MHFLFPKYIFLYIAIHLSFFTYIYLLYLEMLSIVEPYGFQEPQRVKTGPVISTQMILVKQRCALWLIFQG